MKISRTGLLCLILLTAGWAQQQPQPPQQPPANPPQQTQPPTTPPEQTPPEEPQTRGLRPAPPPLVKVPDVRQPGETGYWIGVNGWLPVQEPTIDKGRESGITQSSRTKLGGKPKVVGGAEIGIALGLHNSLRASYFQARASGNFTSPTELVIWTQLYPAGTYIADNYSLRNFKLSFEYLTWPYPVGSRKFRLRTLWQVQYTTVKSAFNAPLLPLVDSNGNPLVDAGGNPLDYNTTGTRSFISPTLGIGVTSHVSRNFRLEASATGFTIPRHTSIWDAEATGNLRSGHFELRFGAKGFHYKTSTAAEFYLRNTMVSGFVGIRWYSD